jgi:Short C-terminal domain
MKFHKVGAAAALLSLSSPAYADEFFGLTPSGSTEAYFPLTLVDASDTLANGCVDVGWTTISSTETVVICELPISAGNAILSALAGPRYATPPRQFIRFNLAYQQGYARVQVSGWQEIQTAFGQTQRTELGNQNYHNNVTFFMVGLGAYYPPGTEFPNHASVNADYEFTDLHGGGMLIKSLEPDGAFARGGLQPGDVVTRIARERIRNNNDVSDGLHRAIRDEMFDVQFYRDGEKMKSEVPRVFRDAAPPLPELVMEEEPAETSSTVIVQNEFSVADELVKLADLKDKGIITQEEFERQKAKLLER